MSTVLDTAIGYIRRGWNPVPIPFREKKPVDNGWQNRVIEEADARRFFNGRAQNIGIVLGPSSQGLTDVDLDSPEARTIAQHLLPQTGSIFGRASNPASHWLYKTTLGEGAEKASIQYQDPTPSANGKRMLVELRVGGPKGAQTVFPGSTHPSGEVIAWNKDKRPAEIDGEELRTAVAAVAAAALLARYWPGEGGRHDAALALGRVLASTGRVESEIERFVRAVATTARDPEVLDRVRAAKDSAAAYAKGERTYGLPKLIELVGQPVAVRAAEWLGATSSTSEAEQEADRIITQDGVADLFAERHKDRLRYCHSTGSWYRWDSTRWRKDETHLAFQFSRKLGREITEGAASRDMREVRKVPFAAGVERFAQSDERLAVTADHWDRDPFLLGTPAGTVDLCTGELRPATPADGITKTVAVAPAETADCPRWLAFLDQTFGGDAGVIRFMQQFSGYGLTGDVSEHALVFGSGGGGNGKGVFANTISGIMGDYATTATMDTFTASKNERHPTELAALRGARLVTSSETERDRAWAEARIKQLTGGDNISARFMRQDFFQFKPQFKLFIIGNHQPELQTVDEAMRRRVNIVPFSRRPANPDRQLEKKLQAEWAGILRWMIEGCLDWQRNGLIRPESIKTATKSYFEEQDLFGQWLNEECDVDQEGKFAWIAGSSSLFGKWSDFAKAAGEAAGNTKSFASAMRRHGLHSERRKIGTVWLGVRPKQDPPSHPRR